MGQGGAQVEAGTCRITKGWVVSLEQASCVSLLAVTEVRILFSHRDWETEALSFLMITLQRNGFQILEKDTPKL